MKSLSWFLGAAALVSMFIAGYMTLENNRLKILNDAHYMRAKIQDDQIREYEFNLSTMKTYDDGFQAAIAKTATGTFSEGYTEGYHNAARQFGASDDKEFLKKMYETNDTK